MCCRGMSSAGMNFCDEFRRVVGGVGVEDPVTEVPLEFFQLPEKLGQCFPLFPEGGGVLGDEDQLLRAAFDQLPGLGDAGLDAAGALPPPEFRDHAVGAAVVAAVGDLQIGHMGTHEQETHRDSRGALRLRSDLSQFVGTGPQVHLGEALFPRS